MEVESYYKEATKLGKKQYSTEGRLVCLENILKDEEIVSNINLGLMEIPLKKVIGTNSYLRSISFSKGFMPIMGGNTEFKSKWMSLCKYHLSEGINDPIKVYEYLNYYYVIEGNKRVSLLKYFNAFSINAEVIRLIPKKKTNDPVNEIYYEFLDFYNETKISAIWFSKSVSFSELSNLLRKYNPTDAADKYKHFLSYIYNVFREVYLKLGGEKLPITTGDAYLEYAKIYGVDKPLGVSKLYLTIKELMKELKHFDNNNLDIQTDSAHDSKGKLSTISNLILPSKQLKIAFVYARSIQSSGWTYGHEIGRQGVEDFFKGKITTKYIQHVPETEQAYDYIKSLAEEGHDVIFTTSPAFRIATLKCALEHKNVKFFNCSDEKAYEHMNCYFGRVHEPIFLSGIIAGTMTKTNIIGYSANCFSSEAILAINSFALGAKIVNPYSKIKVSWTKEWNNHDEFINAESQLLTMNCDVILNRNITLARAIAEKNGTYSMLYSFEDENNEEKKYLCEPIWNWGIYYEKILSSIFNESFKISTNKGSKQINYWYGMDEGVSDIYYSKVDVPITVQRLVKAMRKMIINKEFDIFTGPIIDNKGNVRIKDGEILSTDELFRMDWLVDNVEIDEG